MVNRCIAVCLFLVLRPFGSAQVEEPKKNLVVIAPVANMYSTPAEDSDVVSQAVFGSNVLAVEDAPNWVKIRTPDQYTGWVPKDKTLLAGNPYGIAGKVAQVNGLAANLYRETDVTVRRPLLMVPFDTRLEVIAEGNGNDDGWLQVRLPDQNTAWVQRGDVNLELHPLNIPESIALARQFLGVTYTWGGSSSFGFDCSGFTQLIMRSRGIIMPRDADRQAAWQGVVPIDRRHLRPGDLLFFGSAPGNITHTGMFIGHDKFIHDTAHGHPGVQISRLHSQPWTRLLVASRRIK